MLGNGTVFHTSFNAVELNAGELAVASVAMNSTYVGMLQNVVPIVSVPASSSVTFSPYELPFDVYLMSLAPLPTAS